MIHLLRTRRFLPLFATQALGTFNDNLFKNAFVFLVTFHLAGPLGWDAAAAGALILALFVGPTLLLAAIAGQIADAREPSALVRHTKLLELAAMGIGAAGFLTASPTLLLTCTLLLGIQGAAFAPLKYALLPDHLRDDRELAAATGLIEASTFLAILGGTVAGGLLVGDPGSQPVHDVLPLVLVGAAAVGWLASLGIPRSPPRDAGLKLDANPFRSTAHLLRDAAGDPVARRSLIGLGWFWALGAAWLTLLPVVVARDLHAGPATATLLLALLATGVGTGSILAAARGRRGRTALQALVGPAGVTMTLGLAGVAGGLALAPVPGHAATTALALIGASTFILAAAGGAFSVPLITALTGDTAPAHRARRIAANAATTSGAVVAAGGAVAGLSALGLSPCTQVGLLAAANLAVVARFTPETCAALLRSVVRLALRAVWRVRVQGLGNLDAAGPRRVIISNHLSFVDAVVLGAFLPGRPVFAINATMARRWWVRPAFWAAELHPLDAANPYALKTLATLAKSGRPVVIFPEGRLTRDGALMKCHDGAGVVAHHAQADIVPVWIDGLERTPFAKSTPFLRLRWLTPVRITVGRPVPAASVAVRVQAGSASRRGGWGRELEDLLAETSVAAGAAEPVLFPALLAAARSAGWNTPIAADLRTSPPLTYRQLVGRALALAPALGQGSLPGEAVGLLLPTSVGGITTFFGLSAGLRVPALLNPTAGTAAATAAVRAAQIRTVWTSRAFVAAARLDSLVRHLVSLGVTIRWIEDAARPTTRLRLRYLAARLAPALTAGRQARPDDAAVILFTSGSSGTPKGVVLSHANLAANRRQLQARLGLHAQDRVFNCLPLFHSFGLGVGTLLPLLSGTPIFLHPSPLDVGSIGELVRGSDSTILLGTSTFLAGWARRAQAGDFSNLRLVFAGAERVSPQVRHTYADTFGVRILEGYGCTECAPAIAINTPRAHRTGTIGRLLPGIQARIEAVDGLASGGRLLVRGPNVMLGYLHASTPGILDQPAGGWHDTGDIVASDGDGFLTLRGRTRRFAKLGGEMVSLTAVEELAESAWPGARVAAVTRAHAGKGEEIVLFSDRLDATPGDLRTAARTHGIPEIAVPRTVLILASLPILGSGKPDYPSLERLATSTTEPAARTLQPTTA